MAGALSIWAWAFRVYIADWAWKPLGLVNRSKEKVNFDFSFETGLARDFPSSVDFFNSLFSSSFPARVCPAASHSHWFSFFLICSEQEREMRPWAWRLTAAVSFRASWTTAVAIMVGQRRHRGGDEAVVVWASSSDGFRGHGRTATSTAAEARIGSCGAGRDVEVWADRSMKVDGGERDGSCWACGGGDAQRRAAAWWGTGLGPGFVGVAKGTGSAAVNEALRSTTADGRERRQWWAEQLLGSLDWCRRMARQRTIWSPAMEMQAGLCECWLNCRDLFD